ncbi:MAG: hypothetical protein A3K06_02110 [Candidatus Doudnabacteria bacterium RIFCSPHIGHO2_01_52_17]|uniref:Uncharacterized protein n=1 Tax=Candidatus Doudnabacteria bacterium RIFCSPHIGHO2_01_52_17 TaxID=1817820 RepID=A0A1F5NG74_9BACT|nr:MAG: hypothetical protein A3K06_02110 [Candidatus Doudnabacteria bacterium RIFCSPHIGHO2_01_52_17]
MKILLAIASIFAIVYFSLSILELKVNRYYFLGDEACKKDYGFLADLCIKNKTKLIIPKGILGEIGGP